MKKYETELKKVEIEKNISGNILDIGGGGEGIIGRVYKEKVTAIDKRQDELDEAPDGPVKIVMDAGNLDFDNNVFDAVTSFFTMMYIGKDKHADVFKEAYRVLKPNGKLYLWDTAIQKNNSDYDSFIIYLKVDLPEESVTTGYGIGYREQNIEYFKEQIVNAGFKIDLQKSDNDTFYIVAQK